MSDRPPILFDLQDLRDKLLEPVEVQRDADGYYSHPALPNADEDTNFAKLMEAFGLELGWVSMDSQAGDLYEKMVEDSSPDCSAWSPTPPRGEGWVLIDIGDTEDGPYAWYVRPAVRQLPTGNDAAPIPPTRRKPAAHPALSQAARDVVAERQRQITAEGYDTDHDDEHVNDEIAALAALFLMPEGAREWDATSTGYGLTLGSAMLPNYWNEPRFGDRRDQLVKGTALGLAEIERMDREAARQMQQEGTAA